MNLVLDTNIWISYFMSAKHVDLVNVIFNNNLNIYTNDTLIAELEDVLGRPKIKKYLKVKVHELINFHRELCIFRRTIPIYNLSPDPNDNFLFDLAIQTNSKYVVTGDKTILAQKPISFQFISKSKFEIMFK